MNEQISRTISGSATPAHDLLRLVSAGQVSRDEAERAYTASRGRRLSLEDAAESERDFMRRYDC